MDLLCIGTACADIIVKPVEGVDFHLDLQTVDSIQIQTGGDGLNAAIAAAGLGCDVAFAARVGADRFAQIIREALRRYSICTDSLRVDDTRGTSSVIVLVREDGNRCFLFYGGANYAFHAEDIDRSLLRKAKIVHISGTYQMPMFDGDGAASILREAKRAGKTTSMDVNWDHSGRWLDTIRESLAYLDYFIPSAEEASKITGCTRYQDMAGELLSLGVGNVIIKCGADGAYFRNRDEAFRLGAHHVPVVDTTGAGDTFVGGVLTGLVRGMHMEDCMRLGTAAAAYCVQCVGATAGTGDYAQAIRLMRECPVQKLCD